MSPSIHGAFLRERGLDGTYDAFPVPAGQTRTAIARLKSAHYLGLNVTTPLKEEAFDACQVLDDAARSAGSVNTIVLSGDRVFGTNTDGAGAVHALGGAIGSVDGAFVLVLGAGPTARASIVALKAAGAHVLLWNRTHEKAAALAQRYGVRTWDRSLRADVALSTLPPNADTPYELQVALLTCPAIVDANYGARATLGRLLDRPVIDGVTMLQGSARESFEIWMQQRR